ncbi:MAG: LysO family transporter [Bacteroidales bacterium]|nr:LysO family transporter [Bacteroidales bacterium]
MLKIVLIMAAGILAGFLLRNWKMIHKIGGIIFVIIILLLFVIGISVGSNEMIMDNLASLGGQALLIATASSLGSALAALAVYKLFFKKSRGEKADEG